MKELDHSVIEATVSELKDIWFSRLSEETPKRPCQTKLPSKEKILEIVKHLQYILFPIHYSTRSTDDKLLFDNIKNNMNFVSTHLMEQIKRGICFDTANDCSEESCNELATSVVTKFIRQLPSIQRLLLSDVNAAYEGDPAATSKHEVIFSYPGILAITYHRIAHELFKLRVPIIPRIISEQAHSITGIDIHPGAQVSDSLFIDHGTGVVIGETTVIGSGVRIYQGVTLGAKSFPLDKSGNPVKGIARHPIIGNNVIIYAGATILGRITVGNNCVIGANMWITDNVADNSKVIKNAYS